MRERLEWDEEPIGDVDEGKRRRWRRPWHVYACFLLGAVGVVVCVGAGSSGALWDTVAGLCLLGATWALVRADGPRARAGAPPPPPPTRRVELGWYAVTAALVVLAAVLLGT